MGEAQVAELAALDLPWAEHGPVFATAEGGWTHPDNLKRALTSVIEWSDPTRFKRRATYVRGFTPTDLMAQLEAGERRPDLSPHDLRHTYATLALRRRAPVDVVSKTLGHARVSITLDIYWHVLESELREHVVDLFGDHVPVRMVVPSVLN